MMQRAERQRRGAPIAVPAGSLLWVGLLVFLCYYLGVRIAFALTFDRGAIATLWPPNAVLFASFVLVPTRWWWVVLLAGLPAHLVGEFQSHLPPVMIPGWYLANCCGPVIGAAALRRVASGPPWFSSFRRIGVFVGCACTAACVTSLLGAFVMHQHLATAEYWAMFGRRFWANTLSLLTVVPPIVALGSGEWLHPLRVTGRRATEVGIFSVALLLVSVVAFVWQTAGPGTDSALLYAPVPLLLWAAVRFGPGGVSASLLVVVVFSIWGAVHGRGPFVGTSPQENALAIQLLFIMMSIALLSLSAVLREREQAQESARQNKDQLELALNAAVMGSWEWRIKDSTVLVSAEARRALGVPTRDRTLTVDEFYGLVHRDDRRRVREALSRAVVERAAIDIEFRVVLADGTVRWMLTKGRVVADAPGDAVRMLGLSEDVTERKRADALRIGQNNLLEMVALGAPLTRVLDALAALVESQVDGLLCSVLLLEADRSHIRHAATGSLPPSYVHALDGSAIGPQSASWGAALDSRKPVITRDIDDDPLWATFHDVALAVGLRSCWAAPVLSRQGAVLGFVAIYSRESRTPGQGEKRLIETVTAIASVAIERSRADEALQLSQQRYRLATASGNVGVWDWDLTTNHLYVDPHIKTMLGYEDHEIGDHLDAWIPHVHPDDVGRVLTLAHARLSDGQSHYEIEHRMIHKDGSVRWFIARGIVIRNVERRATRVIGTQADNTERRRVRAEVEEQHRQLAHLARAAMLGELSGALAHELNQPLSAILANAAAGQRFLAQVPPNLSEVREVLADIVHDDNRAGAVIARLRSLLKKGERRLQRLDINEIVADVLVLVRSDLIERRVLVETKLAPGLPLVLGDRVQAQQVLLNLLLNACDAMSDNPPRDRQLTIVTAPGDSGVLLSVVDQGVGIPEAIMDRIFEPFFTSKEHGMGLGLAICRSIMRTQGGRLWATNNPDRGATLWVEFGLETSEFADQFAVQLPFGDVAIEPGARLPHGAGLVVTGRPVRAD